MDRPVLFVEYHRVPDDTFSETSFTDSSTKKYRRAPNFFETVDPFIHSHVPAMDSLPDFVGQICKTNHLCSGNKTPSQRCIFSRSCIDTEYICYVDSRVSTLTLYKFYKNILAILFSPSVRILRTVFEMMQVCNFFVPEFPRSTEIHGMLVVYVYTVASMGHKPPYSVHEK